MEHTPRRDYLDLIVLVQEFGLPPELLNEAFDNFEIHGRQSKVSVAYIPSSDQQEKFIASLLTSCRSHPLYMSYHSHRGVNSNMVYFDFWMSMAHKEEDMAIQRDISKFFEVPETFASSD